MSRSHHLPSHHSPCSPLTSHTVHPSLANPPPPHAVCLTVVLRHLQAPSHLLQRILAVMAERPGSSMVGWLLWPPTGLTPPHHHCNQSKWFLVTSISVLFNKRHSKTTFLYTSVRKQFYLHVCLRWHFYELSVNIFPRPRGPLVPSYPFSPENIVTFIFAF
jgi:hypothetical protein